MLFVDVFKIIIAALVTALGIQLIYNSVFNAHFDVTSELSIRVGVILLGLLFVMLIMARRLIKEINKVSIITGLNRGG